MRLDGGHTTELPRSEATRRTRPALYARTCACAGIKAVIPAPNDQKACRKRRGSRGGRPVTLDAPQWRGLAIRCDKHATVYRVVVLNAVIAWTRKMSDPPQPPVCPRGLFDESWLATSANRPTR